jgi:predicted kinase
MNWDGLTITIGCPGSGKSTWADVNLPLSTLRLERDRFREALFGSRCADHENPLERSERSRVVTACMLAAMEAWPFSSCAVTDTGLRYEAVAPFIEIAQAGGHPIRLIIVERSHGFLWTNNRIRPHAHRIPDDILSEMIAEFDNPAAWWRHSTFEKHYV